MRGAGAGGWGPGGGERWPGRGARWEPGWCVARAHTALQTPWRLELARAHTAAGTIAPAPPPLPGSSPVPRSACTSCSSMCELRTTRPEPGAEALSPEPCAPAAGCAPQRMDECLVRGLRELALGVQHCQHTQPARRKRLNGIQAALVVNPLHLRASQPGGCCHQRGNARRGHPARGITVRVEAVQAEAHPCVAVQHHGRRTLAPALHPMLTGAGFSAADRRRVSTKPNADRRWARPATLGLMASADGDTAPETALRSESHSASLKPPLCGPQRCEAQPTFGGVRPPPLETPSPLTAPPARLLGWPPRTLVQSMPSDSYSLCSSVNRWCVNCCCRRSLA